MKSNKSLHRNILEKSPTGIQGFDEITGGGLPTGRPTLICGDAGCGKTLFGMEFLVRGATQFNEPGVFISFEETEKELTTNVSSLGFDLEKLSAQKKILLDYIHIERSEIHETGEYDLEGLFVRLSLAIDTIGAKRLVLDTIESLFGGLSNDSVLRAELRRLFRWLKDRGLTVVITGERGEGTYTRHGLEEYVSDCVIILDHRIKEQSSTRRLRVVKYRGSSHGTNEYPFLIGDSGFSVFPITSLGLAHIVSKEGISSGIPELDSMLGKNGFYRGSSVLVSGTAGTGKSSLSAHFANAACRRGERVLYFAFEESQNQILRNTQSIGFDLEQWIKQGLLKFHSTRSSYYGLEMHLAVMHKEINTFKPNAVILDPLNSIVSGNNELEAKWMSLRLIDYLKINQITGFFTNLTTGDSNLENTNIFISSLIDTWILLRDIEIGGERNRGLYILKSRGMVHSNQIREFLITNQGIKLRDMYIGMEGVLTGSSRLAQEAKEKTERLKRQQDIEHKKAIIERKRKAMEVHIAMLRSEFESEEAELHNTIGLNELAASNIVEIQSEMAKSRKVLNNKK